MIETKIDPVCGMDIDDINTAGKSDYMGQTYYFCSADCKNNFDEKPEEYINGMDAI